MPGSFDSPHHPFRRRPTTSRRRGAIGRRPESARGGGRHARWRRLADIGAHLVVSIAALLVIGAALAGYQAIDRFNGLLDQLAVPVESASPLIEPGPASTPPPSLP